MITLVENIFSGENLNFLNFFYLGMKNYLSLTEISFVIFYLSTIASEAIERFTNIYKYKIFLGCFSESFIFWVLGLRAQK